jgi:hypothetical protein
LESRIDAAPRVRPASCLIIVARRLGELNLLMQEHTDGVMCEPHTAEDAIDVK